MKWKPVLDGALRERAEASVREIAQALEGETSGMEEASYGGGYSGLALFHGYLARVEEDERRVKFAEERLDEAMTGMSGNDSSLSFFCGSPGIAWTLQHLVRLLTETVDPGMTRGLDESFIEGILTTPWQGHYDLVYGLAGLGCYALDHPDRGTAIVITEKIVEHFDTLVVERDGGLTWWTPPHLTGREIAKRCPDGYYDLGVAHGVAGALGMLARACGAGIAVPRARRLVEGAVRWLQAQKRPDERGSTFPAYLGPHGANSCRSAWCYGDPGIAAILLLAARAVGNATWEREAIAIALHDCDRQEEETGIVDAEFCHGAAGLGHIYNRLYQATGESRFAHASRRWFGRTLDFRRPGEGVAGYLSWWPEVKEWHAQYDLLNGAAGIGLALLAAISSLEPKWDQPLLLAVEPKEHS